MSQMTIQDDRFIGFRVKYELERQDLTQAWLARNLSATDMYIGRRIRGEVPFGAVELAQVAQLLGVEITVFFPPATPGERAS